LFPVLAAQTFIAGALVVLASGTIAECGADPASVLGIALAPASVGLASAGSIYGGTNIPVFVISPNDVIVMGSSTTPVFATHVGTAYGIVKSTNWLVDVSEVAATRIIPVEVSVANPERWFVRFNATCLQFDQIAS
jgi:hypothetical protein